MFCPKCGTTNPDTNNWCSFCGSALQSAPQPQHHPAEPPRPLSAPGGDRQALARIASGPLFLTAVILYVAGLILTLISTLTGSYAESLLSSYASIDIQIDLSAMEQSINSSMIPSQLISSLPAILTIVACFMVFLSARTSPTDRPMPTAGLTILQVITTVTLVLYCIFALLAVVLVVIFAVLGTKIVDGLSQQMYDLISQLFTTELSYSPLPGEIASLIVTFLITVCVIFVLALALCIVQNAFTIRTVRSAKDVCRTGSTTRRPSLFVAIFLFIIGGSNAISLFSVFSLLAFPEMYGLIPVYLSSTCSGVAMILFGVVILQFRSALRKPIAPANPYFPAAGYPVYPQSPTQLPQWEPPYQGNDPWQGQ